MCFEGAPPLVDRTIYRNHRSELWTLPEEEARMALIADAARSTYNWALRRQERILGCSADPDDLMDLECLKRQLTQRLAKPRNEYLREVPRDALDNALFNLNRAYSLYLRQRRDCSNKGYVRNAPQPKRTGRCDVGYTLSYPRLEERVGDSGHRHLIVTDGMGLRYWLKCRDLLPEDGIGRPISAAVKREFGRWYLTLQFKEHHRCEEPLGSAVGVDLGFKTMATDSDGTFHERHGLSDGERSHLQNLRRKLKRQRPGSTAAQTTESRIAMLRRREHARIDNCQHQVSSDILGRHRSPEDRPASVVLDHLNFSEIHDSSDGFASLVKREHTYQLFLKLRIKAGWQGTEFVEADRKYPSSKTCHRCGWINWKLTLDDRTYRCPRCGLEIDRDVNAALNLKFYRSDWRGLIEERVREYQEAQEFDQAKMAELADASYAQKIGSRSLGRGVHSCKELVSEQ